MKRKMCRPTPIHEHCMVTLDITRTKLVKNTLEMLIKVKETVTYAGIGVGLVSTKIEVSPLKRDHLAVTKENMCVVVLWS